MGIPPVRLRNRSTTLSVEMSSTGARVASPIVLFDPRDSLSSVKHASSSFQSSFSHERGPRTLNSGRGCTRCRGPGVSNMGRSSGRGSLTDAPASLVNDPPREGVLKRCSTVRSASCSSSGTVMRGLPGMKTLSPIIPPNVRRRRTGVPCLVMPPSTVDLRRALRVAASTLDWRRASEGSLMTKS